jgi:hypothetical protein
MMNSSPPVAELSDSDLLAQIRCAAQHERQSTARLIALLMELDARRLYLGEGFSSLFTYCTQALHLSEHAAYNRIETARAARRIPPILEMVAGGAVTLTTIRLLAPHLTIENHHDVLERARHKSKRDVEVLIASLSPQPDVMSAIRKLPVRKPSAKGEPATVSPSTAPKAATPHVAAQVEPFLTDKPDTRSAEVKPLAPKRYKIQFTVNGHTYEKLRRVQDLLRHTIPDGDPALIFDRALALLVHHLERRKRAATDRPRSQSMANTSSRHIPASVKRTVWRRDGGRCAFEGSRGRCTETGFLEYHHVVPFAAGGRTSVENLELRCRAHNQYEADCYFGGSDPFLFRERGLST